MRAAGYVDPILKKHEVPFALYVPTSFPDRIGEIWWVALERVVANNDRIGLYIDGRERRFDCERPDDKKNIYEQLYWWLRSLETEDAFIYRFEGSQISEIWMLWAPPAGSESFWD